VKPTVKPSNGPTDPLIGQRIGGKYRVDRLIGRGGVGLVYLAHDSQEMREVVIKVLAPHWEQDGQALARFDREAKRLSGLHHPNIVEMYDFGHENGRSYLVMEHLRGELLSDFVARKGRVPLDEFVPISAQILKGIGHAHLREMMMRDVKPANIMLCERKGRANFVKILDFGLAKLLQGDTKITEEHVLGTVGYVAPEAIKGEAVDLRVDVYALGVLFYYMLAGRLPFEDETNASVFYKTLHEPPPDLRELLGDDHGVPEGVIELIESCLAKHPDDRPADADRIVERLIDVVPASLFRLPRARVDRPGVPRLPPGAGNTGMMELVGVYDHAAPGLVEGGSSAELPLEPGRATPLPGSLRPLGHHAPPGPPGLGEEPTVSASADTGENAPLRPAAGLSTRLIAMSVGAGAIVTALVLGIVMLAVDEDDEGKPTTTASDRGDVDTLAALDAALDAIEASIGAGELDQAAAALDRVRDATEQQPTLRGRVDRLDRRLLVERLVASAAMFEGKGDIAAAVDAYRDALEADPTHAAARSALSRLSVKQADDESAGDAYGKVEIMSRPLTNLQIDGTGVGTTPFRGKLPVGRHEIRMTARGYEAWSGALEVTATDNLPLSVQLQRAGTVPKPDRKTGKQATTGPTTPKPPDSKAETKADPVPDKPDRKSDETFLPTKKKGEDEVFLPTAKTP
jgi:hypothetical protein